MDSQIPPAPPISMSPRAFSHRQSSSQRHCGWEVVVPGDGSVIPCQRSLHAGAVWKDNLVIFGGYDGLHRVNDIYSFNFKTSIWSRLNDMNAPSPRDRHVAVVHENCLYIFGGFDGLSRVNDLHAYDLERNQWRQVGAMAGQPPSPRHSHSAVVYQDAIYIFGGYDGSYRSDFHSFHFPTQVWRQVMGHGDVPRARYRGTCVVCGSAMILHGGHDGTRHLQDSHIFDFQTQAWSTLITEGPVPSPRDSHVAVIYQKSMFLYGGSTGSAMSDFHELKLEFRRVWSPVTYNMPGNNGSQSARLDLAMSTPPVAPGMTGRAMSPTIGMGRHRAMPAVEMIDDPFNPMAMMPGAPPSWPQGTVSTTNAAAMPPHGVLTPGARFCHVGVVHDGSLYIFGGYDGVNRLNDFMRYRFTQLDVSLLALYPSTIITDLRKYVNSDLLADVTFVVEGRPVYAHKILCLRCPFFRTMLTGEYMESHASAIPISDVKYATFLLLLEYLYTDEVQITVDTAMELFQVADRFAIDRLKHLCEQEMLQAIDVDTAANIFYTADQHNAENLRGHCKEYILRNFDAVSRTSAFMEMGRTNVELIFEILRDR